MTTTLNDVRVQAAEQARQDAVERAEKLAQRNGFLLGENDRLRRELVVALETIQRMQAEKDRDDAMGECACDDDRRDAEQAARAADDRDHGF